MPQSKPRSGEKYRHFKNKLYQIVTVAKHSETGEELVIYQALYDDFKVYARPMSMFISEVDREKYPQVQQRYRFMLVEEDSFASEVAREVLQQPPQGQQEMPRETTQVAGRQQEAPSQAAHAVHEDKDITELLMDFYDARSYEEKYQVLLTMKSDITDVMINNMAVVLDVVIPEGSLDKRYEELKTCLKTYQKYETNRGY